jgi:hypothetical protein
VVTVVRNEAARLPLLLASLREFRERGGEVLVLDTGSEDDTCEVAAAALCRVVREPKRFGGRLSARQAEKIDAAFARGGEAPLFAVGERLFHFARAREHAMSLARHDFQLAIDGGDQVDRIDVDFLDSVARSRKFGGMQFETRVRTTAGWSLEVRDRFCDRRAMGWRGRSHECLDPRPPGADLTIGALSRDQLLVSHHSDLGKSRTYLLAGTALDALAEPRMHRWRYFLARGLAARGSFKSGLEVALALDRPSVPPSVRSAALCFAARCVAGSHGSLDGSLAGSKEQADALLFRAAVRDSSRRDPLLRLASRRLSEGDLQGAVSFASAALAVPARVSVSEPEENFTTRPHAILYWALLWLGRRDEAKVHFDICRSLDPANPEYAGHARLFVER